MSILLFGFRLGGGMMERLTIDDVIEHCKRTTEKYENLNGINALETADISLNFIKEYWEHRQVKEYLEELKCYKNDNDFSDYADRLHKIAFNSGYNKAIDDFAGRLIRYVDCGHLCSPTEVRWSDLSVVEMVKKLAEQLKVGAENERM